MRAERTWTPAASSALVMRYSTAGPSAQRTSTTVARSEALSANSTRGGGRSGAGWREGGPRPGPPPQQPAAVGRGHGDLVAVHLDGKLVAVGSLQRPQDQRRRGAPVRR